MPNASTPQIIGPERSERPRIKGATMAMMIGWSFARIDRSARAMPLAAVKKHVMAQKPSTPRKAITRRFSMARPARIPMAKVMGRAKTERQQITSNAVSSWRATGCG